MLAKMKLALRLSNSTLDTEITDSILACYADMKRIGIQVYDENGRVRSTIESDPLIIACMTNYVRWQFDYEHQAERYEKAYVFMRNGLGLCGDYNA